MKAHKHSEMIKAKADDMELVIFRLNDDGSWDYMGRNSLPHLSSYQYFLCLPQHKEACLHWLNGRDIEARIQGGNSSFVNLTGNPNKEWSRNTVFMSSECEIRIKSRKEKRWIAFKWDNFYVLPRHYETKSQAESAVASSMMGEFQYKEIEIEV